MKKRSYYRLWTELLSKHPELSQNKNYFDMIENGYEVVIGDLTFGKNENRNAYEQYYVETKEPYGFEKEKYNFYDDLVPDSIREYLPNSVIRGIRNAKSDFVKRDGEYLIEYEYLPMESKNASNLEFSNPVILEYLKIGDWVLVENNRWLYDQTNKTLLKKYNADFTSFLKIGEYLQYNSYDIKEGFRNKKNLQVIIQNLLISLRENNTKLLKSANNEFIQDQIHLITTLLKLPIIIQVDFDMNFWKYGVTSVPYKDDAKFFIDIVNNQNLQKKMAESLIKNPTSQYKNGGNIAEENYQMAFNDANTISHHAKELLIALKNKQDIPAWVVAKLHQSSTTLSDITHYLEGTKFATGGSTTELAYKIGTPLKMKYSNDNYQLVSLSNSGYTVAKKLNGELVEYKSYPYNIFEHGLFTKA